MRQQRLIADNLSEKGGDFLSDGKFKNMGFSVIAHILYIPTKFGVSSSTS